MPAGAPRAARTPARDRFIETTAELLQRQGYAGTGLTEITERSDAPKGSLYFYFPDGKEQLAAHALQLAGERFAASLAVEAQRTPDAAAAVRAFVSALSTQLQASGFQLGCPIATTALEQAATSDRLREAVHAAFNRWSGVMRAALQADGREPAIADEQAMFVLSAIEGALILARAARSTRPLRVASQQLVTYLRATQS
jgi:TetR/AcrR family transcriptional repressor of lmrAB and yxaGH operons